MTAVKSSLKTSSAYKVMTNDRFDLEAVSSPRSDMAAR